VNCVVFDKTGTLTIGKPVVVNTKLLTNMVLREFYELVAAAEVGIQLLSFTCLPMNNCNKNFTLNNFL